ncbi:MAG: hypothetical protein ABI609_18355 [Acidobacteriota bacterium]
MSRLRNVLCGAAVALVGFTPASGQDGEAASAIARGDIAWAQRGEGQNAGRAAAAPIAAAVAAYEEALAADPKSLDARARLLRALWFQGDYATADNSGKQKIFERGKAVSEQGIDQLAAGAGGRKAFDDLEPARQALGVKADPGAPVIFFWSAVHWGLWGDAFGKFAAARQGVAGKIRDRCLVVLALDERLENGGGHRVLGRLHAVAPHIPFITGWIDHDFAIAELRNAIAISPHDPLNQQFLAEALLEHGNAQEQAEGKTMLRAIVGAEASTAQVTEWAFAKAVARELLAPRP